MATIYHLYQLQMGRCDISHSNNMLREMVWVKQVKSVGTSTTEVLGKYQWLSTKKNPRLFFAPPMKLFPLVVHAAHGAPI